MAVGRSEATMRVAEDEFCWGNVWLPAILEAIGGWEGNSKVYGIRLHAEYGKFTYATIMFGCGSEFPRQLRHYGTNWLADTIGAPRGLQAITVSIEEGFFVICECRYAPIETPIEAVVAALKASEDGS